MDRYGGRNVLGMCLAIVGLVTTSCGNSASQLLTPLTSYLQIETAGSYQIVTVTKVPNCRSKIKPINDNLQPKATGLIERLVIETSTDLLDASRKTGKQKFRQRAKDGASGDSPANPSFETANHSRSSARLQLPERNNPQL